MEVIYIIGSLVGMSILIYGRVHFGKKGEKVYFGAGRWLYKKLPNDILRRIEDTRKLRLFEVATRDMLLQKERERMAGLIGVTVCIFTLFQGVGVMVMLKEIAKKPARNIYLERDDYDGEERSYPLFVTLQGEQADSFKLSVSARTYSGKELDKLFEESFQRAWKQILGDNKTYAGIERPITILQELPDSPVKVNLWWEEDNYINEEGELLVDAFEDGTRMQLYLELSYQGERRQQQMPIILKKPVYTKKELLLHKVKDKLSSLEQQDTTKETVVLPSALYGASITAEEEKQPMLLFLLAGIVIPVFLWLKNWQDEQEQKAVRARQLKEDYPKLLYKMVLYLGAGITMKGCFEAINREWGEAQRRESLDGAAPAKRMPRYLQMEVYALVQQLNMGVPELACYEEWGKQLNESQYLKLTNMIIKNLSKGSAKLLSTMKQERSLALREHREQVKKRGEEASTKLLFPMLLLLLTAMLIVLIPAFFQFV